MAFPLNRRQLLGAGLAAAIPSAHAFIPVKVPQKWDDTVDVLCVGTGFSGLAAAIEAHNAGASVLVIDKMALPGGNSILAAGGFAAPGNDMQKKAGIKDSPELLLADMLPSKPCGVRKGRRLRCLRHIPLGHGLSRREMGSARLSGRPFCRTLLQLYERHRSRHHRPDAHEALHTEGSCASAHEAPQLCYR